MQRIDSQGRILIPGWTFERADLNKNNKLMLAYCGERVYEIIPCDDVLVTDKVCSDELSMDAKNRIIIPMTIRKGYSSWATLYVQDNRLFMEFFAYADEMCKVVVKNQDEFFGEK